MCDGQRSRENRYGESNGFRRMPALADRDAGQKNRKAAEKHTQWIAETDFHLFAQDLFSLRTAVVGTPILDGWRAHCSTGRSPPSKDLRDLRVRWRKAIQAA